MADKMKLVCVSVNGGPVLNVGKAYSSPLSGTGPASAITDIKISGSKVTFALENGSEDVVIGGVICARYAPEVVEPEPEQEG